MSAVVENDGVEEWAGEIEMLAWRTARTWVPPIAAIETSIRICLTRNDWAKASDIKVASEPWSSNARTTAERPVIDSSLTRAVASRTCERECLFEETNNEWTSGDEISKEVDACARETAVIESESKSTCSNEWCWLPQVRHEYLLLQSWSAWSSA